MKKLSSLLFCLLLAVCSITAQTSGDRVPVTSSAQTTTHFNTASRATACDQFAGTLKHDITYNGIMFDVVARKDIIITSLDNVFWNDSVWVYVYYQQGTHVGHEDLQANWTFIDSAYIGKADTVLTRIPVFINQRVNTADTIAFYITCKAASAVSYSYGTTLGAVAGQDLSVKVLQGTGVGTNTGDLNPPRLFNGNVNYCPAGQQVCPDERTTTETGFSADGIMFDIKATKNITINTLATNMRVASKDLAIYTKANTHIGFEVDSTKWTHVKDVTFNTVVNGDSLVTVVLPTPITLDSGKTIAFYARVIDLGGGITYGGKVTPPQSAYNSGLFQLSAGTAGDGSFMNGYYPRVWNGVVGLCARVAALGLGEAKRLELSLYPNPANDILNITTEEHEPVTLDIIDMQGRAVITTSFLGSATLDVARLPASVYQLYLHNANGMAVKRFVKN
jgi:hypothetical protein